MFINSKNFFAIDDGYIDWLRDKLIPIWGKDYQIESNSFKLAKYLMRGGMEGMEESKKENFSKSTDGCKYIPKFVLTKTSLEIIKKIKVSPSAIAMIEQFDGINKFIQDNRGHDLFAHISLHDQFFRYIIINNHIYVVHIYLDTREGETEQYVSYSIYNVLLGGTAEEYKDAGTVTEHNRLFFQILIFLKYTDPDIKIIPSGKKVGTKKNGYFNLTKTDIQVVDSTWNTTVMRTEGFSVNGHLRLQPCGEGNKKRKLIWIEPFEKHGYVREAKSQNK
jgi:hypothetical protein